MYTCNAFLVRVSQHDTHDNATDMEWRDSDNNTALDVADRGVQRIIEDALDEKAEREHEVMVKRYPLVSCLTYDFLCGASGMFYCWKRVCNYVCNHLELDYSMR